MGWVNEGARQGRRERDTSTAYFTLGTASFSIICYKAVLFKIGLVKDL